MSFKLLILTTKALSIAFALLVLTVIAILINDAMLTYPSPTEVLTWEACVEQDIQCH
jgi:hypothetical protein